MGRTRPALLALALTATLTPDLTGASHVPTSPIDVRRLGVGTMVDDDAPPPPTLSISDIGVPEGNANTIDAWFTVSLSRPPDSGVSVDFATADGSASAGSDYLAKSGSLAIPAGQTSAQFRIRVVGDTVDEPDEDFFVNLSDPAGATIDRGRGVGTIEDDDMTPLPAGDRPNVLVIVTDDQRRIDTMGVMPKTYEWFGAGGTEYPRAVATTPLCCPSRATIMTGRYAHNHGILTNKSTKQLDHPRTIQRYLQDTGYLTAIAGKFLNNFDYRTQTPPNFDRWAVQGKGYYDAQFNVDGTLRTVPEYSTRFIDSWSSTVLSDFEARDETPWLLYLAPFAPHEPFTPEAEYANADVGTWAGNPAVLEPDRSDKPPWVASTAGRLSDARALRVAQLRTLLSVDDLVDNVLRQLEALGEENTLALFLSDNGYTWAEHGLLGKAWPYLQSIEIPLYARWPGHIAQGAVDERLVGTVDLVSTILEVSGASPDPSVPLDGESLLGDTARDRILTENWEGYRWAGLLGTGYQYIEWYDDAGSVTFREFYDLTNDPWQLENVLADGDPLNDPDVSALSAQLARDRGCAGTTGENACPAGADDPPPPPPPPPALSIGDVSVLEGNEGSVPGTFTVSLSSPAVAPVTVDYATADDVASAGSDYTAVPTAQLTIPAGETSGQITIPVLGDTEDEPDEAFFVDLSNASGATIADGQGTGTIIDDDDAQPPPQPTMSIEDAAPVTEGVPGAKVFARFTVSLSSATSGPVTFTYATADDTATAGSGDYTSVTGTATISAGATATFAVRVVVRGDELPEPNETLFVDLSNPHGATIEDGRGEATIVDDDP